MLGATVHLRAPRMCVRARIDRIAEAWVVRTPSLDGPTTSLELVDAGAAVVMSLSGARWPGQPEPSAWRALLDDLRTAG